MVLILWVILSFGLTDDPSDAASTSVCIVLCVAFPKISTIWKNSTDMSVVSAAFCISGFAPLINIVRNQLIFVFLSPSVWLLKFHFGSFERSQHQIWLRNWDWKARAVYLKLLIPSDIRNVFQIDCNSEWMGSAKTPPISKSVMHKVFWHKTIFCKQSCFSEVTETKALIEKHYYRIDVIQKVLAKKAMEEKER